MTVITIENIMIYWMCVVIVKYIEIYYFTMNMLITHNSVSPRFGCATPKSIRKSYDKSFSSQDRLMV